MLQCCSCDNNSIMQYSALVASALEENTMELLYKN